MQYQGTARNIHLISIRILKNYPETNILYFLMFPTFQRYVFDLRPDSFLTMFKTFNERKKLNGHILKNN